MFAKTVHTIPFWLLQHYCSILKGPNVKRNGIRHKHLAHAEEPWPSVSQHCEHFRELYKNHF